MKIRFRIQDTSPEFQAFMADYPNDEDVRKAWDEWRQIATSAEAVAAIMAGLARWKASDRWARGYVKAAFRWLRDGMWREHPKPFNPDPDPVKPVENLSRAELAANARDRWLTIKDAPENFTDDEKIAAAIDAVNHWPTYRSQINARLEGWGLGGRLTDAND